MKKHYNHQKTIGVILLIFGYINIVAQDISPCSEITVSVESNDCLIDSEEVGFKYFIEDPISSTGTISVFDKEGEIVSERSMEYSNSSMIFDFLEIDLTESQKFDIIYKNDFGCEIERNITLFPPIDFNYDILNPFCFNDNSGKIQVYKGNHNHSILWDDGSEEWLRSELASGMYSCTISDENCSIKKSFLLESPRQLQAIIKPTIFNCDIESNKMYTAFVTGGIAPYSYEWRVNNSVLTDMSQSSIYYSAGDKIELYVTDSNNCETAAYDINLPEEFNLGAKDVYIPAVQKLNESDVRFDLNMSLDLKYGDADNDNLDGSVFEVSYYSSIGDAISNNDALPSDLVTTQSQVIAKISNFSPCYELATINLVSDQYCLLISESCDNVDPIPLIPVECTSEAMPLPDDGTYEAYKVDTDGHLALEPDAIIEIDGKFFFDPRDREGNFDVIYTYQDGGNTIIATAFFEVQALNPRINIDIDSICGNEMFFEIRANPIGGIISGPGIIDSFISGTNQFYISQVSDLEVGSQNYFTYRYNQNNASGLICSKTRIDSIYVHDFPKVDIEVDVERQCSMHEVFLESRNIDEQSDLSYTWTDPNGFVIGNLKDILIDEIQTEGYYHLTARSPNGCVARDSVLVEVFDNPVLTCEINSQISCPKGTNGSATVEIEEVLDFTGYSFEWSNGSTLKNQTDLNAGTYTVTVTTNEGCKDSCSIVVEEPPHFSIDCTSNITPPQCFNSNDGSNVIIVASGGTPPYHYSKDNITFSSNNTITNLSSGPQKVFIRDLLGCIDSCNFVVPQPTEMTCFTTKIRDVSCFNGIDGSAMVTVSGGELPYRYEWENGEITRTATALGSGLQTVTIFDNNNCSVQCQVSIAEPEELSCQTDVISQLSCFNVDDGSASVTAQGGNGNYSYKWSNGEITRIATSLPEISSVTVTDEKGCETVCAVNITEPTPLTANLEGNFVCEGDMAVVKSNPDSRITNFSWSIGSLSTGVTLDFTDHMDVKINAMNASTGINTIVFEGTSDLGCAIIDSINIEVLEVESAGSDQEVTICNLDTSAYRVNLWELLAIDAATSGIWSAINPSESPDISNPEDVNFECVESGKYTYKYTVHNNPLCDAQSALVSIIVNDCFDLALRKTADAQMIVVGEPVLFYLDVFNQGDITAFDVEVTDYLENYFSFDITKNTIPLTSNEHDWVLSTESLLTTYIDSLLPKSSKRLKIYLDLDSDIQELEVYNSAEITHYSAKLKNKNFKVLPKDEDDTVVDQEETNDDIDDSDNGSADNPNDDDQFDFEILPLCGSEVAEVACNNLLYLSLDQDCGVFVTPDMILEGDHNSYYTIKIKDEFGGSVSNPVSGDYLGQTLEVTVTDSCGGNSCWGNIILEDKAPAVLECQPIYTTCSSGLEPGDAIAEKLTYEVPLTISNNSIPNNEIWSRSYDINVFGLIQSSTTNIAVNIDIEHESVSDLEATLTSPSGVSRKIFVNPGGTCGEDNISITIDPQAELTAEQLSNTCLQGEPIAIIGNFQPLESFSIFNDIDPSGVWTLTLNDVEPTNGGTIKEISLVVSQQGGTIPFPGNNLSWVEAGDQLFRIDGLDACTTVEAGYIDSIGEIDCDSPFEKIIFRTWHAEDLFDNKSVSCTQEIYVYRNKIRSVIFPPNYDGLEENYLSCHDVIDVPGVDITGDVSGTLCDGIQLFPHQDVRLDICEKSYKILRTFKVVEWCTSKVLEHTQVIKVLDDKGPELLPVSDITLSTDVFECTADISLTRPVVLDDCSESFQYKLSYAYNGSNSNVPPSDGVFQIDNIFSDINNNDIGVSDIGIGNYWVKWIVTDDCGNSTATYHKLTILDQVAPVPVCDEFTVVSLGADGKIVVSAEIFDDGSYDNCGIKTYLARKMTSLCVGENSFEENVTFCCEETNETVLVEFKVVDYAGNENTCMVEVQIQDKLPPYITTCPDDITISCIEDYENTNITGIPEYIDNCEILSVDKKDVHELNSCGLGIITRTWTVVDIQGLKNSCVQKIIIEDNMVLVENDIDWPNDHYATSCSSNLDPENLPVNKGYPRISVNPCNSVVSSYKDQRFVNVEDACEKILRTWTVIDWCRYNESNPVLGEGWFTHVQIIKLQNESPPQINQCSDVTIGTFGNCQGDVNLSITALDDCTPDDQLNYEFKIDLYADGEEDPEYNSYTNNVFRTLPNGVHKISWIVSDQCSNTAECSYFITLEDQKKPTPYCLGSIATAVMDINGTVELWAKDFDLGSFDNCTDQENLKISFSSDITDVVKIFSCSHIPDGESNILNQQIWVTDENGNQDACSVEIFLQDNEANICEEDNSTASVSGNVIVNSSAGATEVFIYNNGDNLYSSIVESDGRFEINGLEKGANYRLEAYNNNGLKNGVNTLDLVAIQRHILGLEVFDEPLQYVAADINNDESIKPSDLLNLRKVILGMNSEFPNEQTSWRFVPESNDILVDNALPYDDFIYIENIIDNIYNQNLVGVKIGDVDGAKNIEFNKISEKNALRNDAKITLFADLNIKYELGNTIVPIYMDEIDLIGMQLTMETSKDKNIESVLGGQLDIKSEQIAYNNNKVSLVWHDIAPTEVNNSDPVFFIVLEGHFKNVSLEDIRVTSTVTEALAFDENMNGYELVFDEKTTFDRMNHKHQFALYQNTPNPFTNYSDIGFYIAESGEYSLSIHDVTGKKLYENVANYNPGKHSIKISSKDLSMTGILFYELKNKDSRIVKKMICLEN